MPDGKSPEIDTAALVRQLVAAVRVFVGTADEADTEALSQPFLDGPGPRQVVTGTTDTSLSLWAFQHYNIRPKKPKALRGRGRPKGSALLEIPIKKSVNLWMDGYTHREIHKKVDPAGRIDPLTLKRSLQRKIQTSLPERQAQIKAAHEAARLRKKKAQ
jgi:hypothetical protein